MAKILESKIFSDGYIVILFEYHGKYLPSGYDKIYYVFYDYTDYDRVMNLAKYQDLDYWKFIQKCPSGYLDCYSDYDSAKKRYDYIVSTHKEKAKPKAIVTNAEIIKIETDPPKPLFGKKFDMLVTVKNTGNTTFRAEVKAIPDSHPDEWVRFWSSIDPGKEKTIRIHKLESYANWTVELWNEDDGKLYDSKRYTVQFSFSESEEKQAKEEKKREEIKKEKTLLDVINEIMEYLMELFESIKVG